MPPRDRSSNDPTTRDPAVAADPARTPAKPLDTADDRGGSLDGEGRDAGDAGDRDQLDNDGGQRPMK